MSASSPSVEVDKTVQLSASARDASGGVLSGKSFTWTSGTPAVAQVGSEGLVKGISAGSSIITPSTAFEVKSAGNCVG